MLLHMLQPMSQPSRSAQKTMNVTGLKNLKMNAAEAEFLLVPPEREIFANIPSISQALFSSLVV